MMSFDVEFPLPPRELSPNARPHFMARARATKRYREDCMLLTLAAKPKGWEGAHPIEIDVVYRGFRGCGRYAARDCQNAVASMKGLVDGIVDAGVIPSDSAKWLSWGTFRLTTTVKEAGNRAGIFMRIRTQTRATPP